MEQTEFVDYEEPSGIQPSQFAAEQEADREQQEEYEAEQKDIEEGVDKRLAEMDDDDLDLVESEDEESDLEFHNSEFGIQFNNQFKENLKINPMYPLSRNIANFLGSGGQDQRAAGISGQFVPGQTSTQIDQTSTNNAIKSTRERQFLLDEYDHKNSQLPILYEQRGNEIKRLKEEMDFMKLNYDKETRSVQHQLAILKGEKEKLIACSEHHKDNADNQLLENQRLKEEAEKLSKRLADSERINGELETELESANLSLSTVHTQLIELQTKDTILKARQNYEENVSSLRERHEKELFQLQQEINKLRVESKSKDTEVELNRRKVATARSEYDALQIEKVDIIKQYQARLDDAQKRLQQQIAENASYTNVRAIDQRAREDKKDMQEKYAQELIKIRDKEEEFILQQKKHDEMKSKYASLKQKVYKYQEHQRKKEQKYLDQIRQTEIDCRSRLEQIRIKTQEAIESKNKKYQEEVLQIQNLFHVEMEKVNTLTLKCTENILESENIDDIVNEADSKENRPIEHPRRNGTNNAYYNSQEHQSRSSQNRDQAKYVHPTINGRNQEIIDNDAHVADYQFLQPLMQYNGNENIQQNVQPTTNSLNKVGFQKW